MSNVVKLKTSSAVRGNLGDLDDDYTSLVRAFVNRKVRDYVKSGQQIKKLALRSGLNHNTVSRLAYYETTRPMWHTVMAVIMALDAIGEFADLTAKFANRKHNGN